MDLKLLALVVMEEERMREGRSEGLLRVVISRGEEMLFTAA